MEEEGGSGRLEDILGGEKCERRVCWEVEDKEEGSERI